MNTSARIFNCHRCRQQTLICTCCDRGNIYCSISCSRTARVIHHRIANAIYQKTFRGRQKHALRQKQYRCRERLKKEKVTDQGSLKTVPHDLLTSAKITDKKAASEPLHCHFCKKSVSPYCRNGYLRYHVKNRDDKLLQINDTG